MIHMRYGLDKQHIVIMTVVLGEISEVFASLNCLHFHVINIVDNAMDWIAFVEGLQVPDCRILVQRTCASDYFNLSSKL